MDIHYGRSCSENRNSSKSEDLKLHFDLDWSPLLFEY